MKAPNIIGITLNIVIEEISKYVKEESKKPHGPYLADAYADVDEEKEEYWNISGD